MFRSIQWKLVIIYFLLVWLAMAIIGVYIIQTVEKQQLNSMKNTIIARANTLAVLIRDEIAEDSNVDDIVNQWWQSREDQIRRVDIIKKNYGIISSKGDLEEDIYISTAVESAMREGREIIIDNEVPEKNFKSIAVPIISSEDEVIGAIYINADFTQAKEATKDIRSILTNATIWALCITVFLGSLLARTITGPIKEVTSKAEKLAKGDFGQVISVKSNDEIGQLTEMFNYLTVKLKDTLDEMTSEKNKVETILTHMTDGVIAVSAAGVIIHANPAAFKLFNIKAEQIVNKSFDEIMHMLNLDFSCEDLFAETYQSFRLIQVRDYIIKANVVHFQNEKNQTAGAILVLQDVTEQEKLDNMRKEFVANVSHELRTPLTTIKSYTETLLSGAIEDKDLSVRFLKVMESEADRMTRLVKDLLQLSKLDYDKTEWNMRDINIYNVVLDCVDKMAMAAKQKEQELNFYSEDGICNIIANKQKKEKVIINVISNAIKYTSEKGKVDVTLNNCGEYILIEVQDNGIGIPKEDLPRIFERFYRVDKARSRALGGTGLGLSIAKQIVEAHKGSIKIDSEYGKGTKVSISLPCKQM